MELSGTWRAGPADEPLRRAFPDPAFDDAGWAEVPVPGHWRSVPSLAASDGPMLYRHGFDAPAPASGRRAWLTFEGLFYQGDAWLDGSYLGDTEGYFFPHTFEVTDHLRDRAEHTLAVELTCAPPADRTAKRNLTGVFQHWDCADADANPGGIWRPVRLAETGPVRIARLRVLCTDASPERAIVSLRAVLDASEAATVTLRTTIGGAEVVADQPLAAGENRVSWSVAVDQPRLWWPHALGEQPLEDLVLEVRTDGDGAADATAVSDRRLVRTGLRRVQMKRWITTVNGERLFLKGANQGPNRMRLAEATPAELEADVALAVDTGLDLLRLHGHISRPELYEAADRRGLLLWQDLPLQWGYARTVRKQAVRQAREAVDLLGHHPSIALWCGHNEPLALDVAPGDEHPASRRTVARFVALQELPTWNKTVLDRSVRRALERADPSRPVAAHSGVWPHPGDVDQDSHLYFGWYHGDERDLPAALARFPRLAVFVSEFGAQAVPESADFLEPGRWPDLDWAGLARHHSLQKAVFDRRVPPAAHATFEGWRAATQRYQADLLRHHIEHLRRLKYRPAGGFCQFSLADGQPGVTWSVVDHERVPKAGWAALRAACAPVIVTSDRLPATVAPGDTLTVDVHVVSDLRRALDDGVAAAVLSWPGGVRRWSWQGAVPADGCVRVGAVVLEVPDAPGPLELTLSYEAGDVVAGASQRADIVRP